MAFNVTEKNCNPDTGKMLKVYFPRNRHLNVIYFLARSHGLSCWYLSCSIHNATTSRSTWVSKILRSSPTIGREAGSSTHLKTLNRPNHGAAVTPRCPLQDQGGLSPTWQRTRTRFTVCFLRTDRTWRDPPLVHRSIARYNKRRRIFTITLP